MPKVRTNVCIPKELRDAAQESGVNISAVLEASLREVVYGNAHSVLWRMLAAEKKVVLLKQQIAIIKVMLSDI